ncbi:MAG: DUF1667 domain-containing protein [Clostridia bacterium]|nr:DUF1667 domain-containing protein [Clostridia bacterium]
MTKEIICTVCPMGCHITVDGEGDTILSVTGFTCKRGEQYASTEFAHPVRILTTTIRTDNEKNPLVPVRSAKPIPKEKVMDCMKVIRTYQAKAPIQTYDVLIENICDTGVDIVATGTLD